jgi:hypothetical protein
MTNLSELRDRAVANMTGMLSNFEPVHKYIPGTLGDAVGTVNVPNRSGYVYVRLFGDSTRTVRAQNMGVLPIAETTVWVEQLGSPGTRERYRVAKVDNSGLALSGVLEVAADRVRILGSNTPASASAAGTAGDICWDANYLYICIATDTWKRVAISTWP